MIKQRVRHGNYQFVAVVMLRHLARTLSGNSSPVTTQATGPHEEATVKDLSVVCRGQRRSTGLQKKM